MKLFKSKKSNNNNNNNNASSSSGGSTSTISCVPGKSSSLNKANDAKADTTTTNSSTTVSGKEFWFSQRINTHKNSKQFSQRFCCFHSFNFINKKKNGAWVNSGRRSISCARKTFLHSCLLFTSLCVTTTCFHDGF